MLGRLEFNLPEDKQAFTMARRGAAYLSMLREIYEYLRRKLKYEELSETEQKIYSKFFDWYINELNDVKIDLDGEE